MEDVIISKITRKEQILLEDITDTTVSVEVT